MTSKKELAEAGRRKLEAFKKQKQAQKKPRNEPQQSPPPRTANAEPTPTPALAQPPSPPASSTRGVGPIPFGQGAQQSQPSPAEEPEEGPVRNSSDASAVAPADLLKQANEFREPPKVDLAIRGPPPLPSSGIARRVFPLPPPLSLARSNQGERPRQQVTANGGTIPFAESLPPPAALNGPSADVAPPPDAVPHHAAQEGGFSTDEDLPVSSPPPSSYAALSDSYLSPDRPDSPRSSEDDATEATSARFSPARTQPPHQPTPPQPPQPAPAAPPRPHAGGFFSRTFGARPWKPAASPDPAPPSRSEPTRGEVGAKETSSPTRTSETQSQKPDSAPIRATSSSAAPRLTGVREDEPHPAAAWEPWSSSPGGAGDTGGTEGERTSGAEGKQDGFPSELQPPGRDAGDRRLRGEASFSGAGWGEDGAAGRQRQSLDGAYPMPASELGLRSGLEGPGGPADEGGGLGGGGPRHGRVASLNAWGKSSSEPAEVGPSGVERPAEQPRGRTDAAEAREGIAGTAVANGFHFEKLPDPQGAVLPSWSSRGSPTAENRSGSHWSGEASIQRASLDAETIGVESHAADPVEAQNGDARADGGAKPPGLPNGSASGIRKEASLAHLAAGDSKAEARQFEALHQHIDELTREKFEYSRGLEQQRQLAANLVSENQRLLDDYNDQGRAMQQLRRALEDREAEMEAQQSAMAALSAEKESCHSLLREALQRSEALASEVVALEEKSLHARSAELRAGKRAEEVALEARKARQLQASTAAECASLRSTIAAFQEEKRIWAERLRQQSQAKPMPDTSKPPPAAPHQANPAPTPTPSPPSTSADALASNPEMLPVDPPTTKESEVARIVRWSMDRIKSLEPDEATAGGELPKLLSLLLPPRTYQGGASGEAAEVAAEERRVVGSINGLLDALQREKEALLLSFNAQQEQCSQLRSRNAELAGRLEVALHQAGGASKPGHRSAPTTPSKPTGALSWIAGVIAPPGGGGG